MADEKKKDGGNDPGRVQPTKETRDAKRARAALRPIPLWQKGMLLVAVAVMFTGAGLKVFGKKPEPRQAIEAPTNPTHTGTAPNTGTKPNGLVSGLNGQPGGLPDFFPRPGDPTFPGVPGTPGNTGNPTPGAPAAPQAAPYADWAPAVFTLGFSYFVGFSIGYALRTFVKMAMLIIGVVALALFAFQYAGLINVDWHSMEGKWESVMGWARSQTSNFEGFIKGQLPAAGLAGMGMYFGFRQR